MMFLPDTNVFSAYLAGRSESLAERMRSEFAAGTLRLSFMVIAELEFGAEKARVQFGTTRFARRVDTLRQQLEIEPPGPEFPRCYAQVRSQLEKSVARSATATRSSPHTRLPSGPYWSPGMATSFRGWRG